jgi:hypothetical protein
MVENKEDIKKSSKNIYETEAQKVISIVKRDLLLPNGALGLERSGNKLRPFNIFSDLGDFLSFLLYFGEEEFIDKQIEILKKELGSKGILVSQFPTLGINGLAKTYEYTDLLLGLTDYYLYKRDEKSKKLLLEVADKAIEIFSLDSNPTSFYKVGLGQLPVLDTRDGTLIECFLDIARATKEKKYIDVAKNIYKHLFNNSFYRKYHLLPTFTTYQWLIPFLRGSKFHMFREAEICKNSTNTIFALHSLYKHTKDESVKDNIFKMIDGIRSLANKSGGIYKTYNPKNKNKSIISLTPSFAMLDLLCDTYRLFRRGEDLAFARDIASFWLKQEGKTGLLPLISGKKDSFIDSETDMSVALIKLYEITGEDKYKSASERIFKGMIEFHGKLDYCLSVNIDTGNLVSDAQRTKFLTLFLKLLILKEKISEGESIYGNKSLFDILRDR